MRSHRCCAKHIKGRRRISSGGPILILSQIQTKFNMKNLLLIILAITSLTVAGQKHLIGVKGGVNITNVSLPNLSNDTKNRVSYIRGLTYEYLINSSFSLSADLLLDLRGFHYEVPMYDDLGHPTGYSGTTREDFTYLSLPLKAGYNIGDNLYGYVNLGVINC
jgi:hypothetical protein